jgi:hypothetical protein
MRWFKKRINDSFSLSKEIAIAQFAIRGYWLDVTEEKTSTGRSCTGVRASAQCVCVCTQARMCV